MKLTIIPVMTAANGTVTKVKKNSEALTETHSKDSLEKTATLGTSQIIREVPRVDTRSLSGRDHLWLKRRRTGEKRHVTRE